MGRRLRKKVSRAGASRAEALALGEEVLLKALREEDAITKQHAYLWSGVDRNARRRQRRDRRTGGRRPRLRLFTAGLAANLGPPAVTPLIAILGDTEEDFIVRGAAAFALGKIGSDRVVKPLMAALGDEHPDVRRAAEDGLRQMGAEGMIKLAAAHSQAATESAAQGAPDLQPLIEALGDKNSKVRCEAVEALAEIGSEAAAEALVDALGSAIFTFTTGGEASWALQKIGVPAVRPLSGALCDQSSRGRRHTAAMVLGKIGDGEAVAPLIEMLNDADNDMRILSATALGRIGDERAIEPLIAAVLGR